MKPNITLCAVSNVFTRMMHFSKAGDEEVGPKQTRDHLMLLSTGSIEVTANDATTKFKAPHMIFIGAGKNYKLTAVVDNTVLISIHAVRDKNTGDIIDPSMVPAGMITDMAQLNAEPFLKQE